MLVCELVLERRNIQNMNYTLFLLYFIWKTLKYLLHARCFINSLTPYNAPQVATIIIPTLQGDRLNTERLGYLSKIPQLIYIRAVI